MRVGVVFAHPDDESMFFGPTIGHYVDRGCEVFYLCLSTGDADGLGMVRTCELLRAAAVFGIPEDHVMIVDDPMLQDGMDNDWDMELISNHIQQFVADHGVTHLVSFDQHGVSGHPNHIAVHYGFVTAHDTLSIPCLQLDTTGFLRKYIGIADIILSWCLSNPSTLTLHSLPLRSIRGMLAHHSQFVWYRKLFILLSRYSYINTLRPICSKTR